MRAFLAAIILLLSACTPVVQTVPQPNQEELLLYQTLDATIALISGNDIYCSGAFIQGDTVLTAAHCIEEKETVQILTRQGKRYGYNVVKRDVAQDLALLTPAVWVNTHPIIGLASEAPSYGDRVVLVGHPYGMAWSVFTGRVNNPSQYGFGNAGGDDHWIMSDNGGGPVTSGGPLMNAYGELVGVNVWHPVGGRGWGASVHLDEIKKFLQEENNAVAD